MNPIMCELCGSNEVVKQGEYFVCQHCGTKYSLEEAKKLLGTVRIDNSDYVERYLQNARRAKAKRDWAEEEKYYNMVETNQPENWEAIFYSSYARVMNLQTDPQHVIPALDVLMHSMDQVIFLVEKMPNDEEAKQLQVFSDELQEMSTAICDGARTGAIGAQITYSQEVRIRYSVAKVLFAFADELDEKIEKYDVAKKLILENYKRGNVCATIPMAVNPNYLQEHGDLDAYKKEHNATKLLISQYTEKIKQIDPNYVQPTEPGGGCYIATAVYGSYDCPQVWVLRRFRDDTLADTWYGRAFIYAYYAISPTLVKLFGEAEWFRNLWKPKLDRMVKRLKNQGVADTPYQDKQW